MSRLLYLVKLGEISLKGQNRDFFEKKLKENIKYKIRPHQSWFSKQKGRLFIEFEKETPPSLIYSALSTTFGIVGFSEALRVEKEIDKIVEVALQLTHQIQFIEGVATFKVESVRSDKGFHLTSYQISALLGKKILEEHPHLSVDVHTPDKTLYVEIRDKAYLFSSPQKGLGGLPVGSAGRGLVMLSGGIDSPVAAYMMAKRGLRLEAIYFHTYPYTSNEAKEKVITLAKTLSPYLNGITLHIVPFTESQLHIVQHAPSGEHTLLMRAAMVKVANMVAAKRRCLALVSGEALSQVASQTVESLSFTNSLSYLPVFRPLIGLDKGEIVDMSKEIGTYETSILPYDDCCTVFSPKHPIVRPKRDLLSASYHNLNIEEHLQKGVEEIETIVL